MVRCSALRGRKAAVELHSELSATGKQRPLSPVKSSSVQQMASPKYQLLRTGRVTHLQSVYFVQTTLPSQLPITRGCQLWSPAPGFQEAIRPAKVSSGQDTMETTYNWPWDSWNILPETAVG
jgi:hypothetical protein